MDGNRIREFREARGYKLTEFAEMIGERKQNLYKYEKGIVTNIPLNKIERMAAVLGVDPAILAGWGDSQQTRIELYYNKIAEKIKRLDDVDRAKIEERIDVMLESDKYQED